MMDTGKEAESVSPPAGMDNGTAFSPPPPPPPPMAPLAPAEPVDPMLAMLRMLRTVLWSSGFFLFLVVLVMGFVVVLAMTPWIQHWIVTPQPGADGDVLPKASIFLIVPQPVVIATLDGPAFQVWHILMLVILTAAFARGLHGLASSWLSGPDRAVESLFDPSRAGSSLESVGKLFMATSAFSSLYFLMVYAGGVEPNMPDFGSMDLPELVYGLFTASVFEELISRVLFIGVPLTALALARKRAGGLKHLLGGNLDLNGVTLALIVFSAVMFALGHVMSWDLWKVPQVLVTGLALGYAFVRHGLHASILIHFTINLSTVTLEIWPGNAALDASLGIAFLVWLFAGLYFLYVYAAGLLRWLSPGRMGPPPEQPAVREPGGFVCPTCGGVSGIYDAGQIICVRCGSSYGARKPDEPPPGKGMVEF